MSRFRVETHNGTHILCGGIIPVSKVQHGQTWMSSGNNKVRVSGVRDEWVGYTWNENGKTVYHEKTNFAFQCRYCLVLDTPELPKWAKESK